MSGAAILRELLAARPGLLALVPSARIVAGMLPQNTPLPAVTVREVSNNEEPTVARNMPVRMTRERVQVTALAREWVLMKRVLKAADLGAGVQTGFVLGFKVCSIIPAGTGPEIPVGDDGIFEQSRDFVVTFLEPN
jgi:hypothetical protein